MLFRDDLEFIVEVLASVGSAEISDEDYQFESLDEVMTERGDCILHVAVDDAATAFAVCRDDELLKRLGRDDRRRARDTAPISSSGGPDNHNRTQHLP